MNNTADHLHRLDSNCSVKVTGIVLLEEVKKRVSNDVLLKK